LNGFVVGNLEHLAAPEQRLVHSVYCSLPSKISGSVLL